MPIALAARNINHELPLLAALVRAEGDECMDGGMIAGPLILEIQQPRERIATHPSWLGNPVQHTLTALGRLRTTHPRLLEQVSAWDRTDPFGLRLYHLPPNNIGCLSFHLHRTDDRQGRIDCVFSTDVYVVGSAGWVSESFVHEVVCHLMGTPMGTLTLLANQVWLPSSPIDWEQRCRVQPDPYTTGQIHPIDLELDAQEFSTWWELLGDTIGEGAPLGTTTHLFRRLLPLLKQVEALADESCTKTQLINWMKKKLCPMYDIDIIYACIQYLTQSTAVLNPCVIDG